MAKSRENLLNLHEIFPSPSLAVIFQNFPPSLEFSSQPHLPGIFRNNLHDRRFPEFFHGLSGVNQGSFGRSLARLIPFRPFELYGPLPYFLPTLATSMPSGFLTQITPSPTQVRLSRCIYYLSQLDTIASLLPSSHERHTTAGPPSYLLSIRPTTTLSEPDRKGTTALIRVLGQDCFGRKGLGAIFS
jgi:hypothetical protein